MINVHVNEAYRLLCAYASDIQLYLYTVHVLYIINVHLSLSSLFMFVVCSCSGNQMGNHGARYLAKVLLTNYHLREVSWDHNDTSLCGLQDVISALKQ